MENREHVNLIVHYPPPNFTDLKLPIIRSKGPWLRIHKKKYTDPIHFGLAKNKTIPDRFDDPKSEFGVLYMGYDEYACFIEVFSDFIEERILPKSELKIRNIVNIKSNLSLRLVKLYGSSLAKIGADSSVTSGKDRELSMAWSRAIFEHPQNPDGIIYKLCHDNIKRGVALFEKERTKINLKSRIINTLDRLPNCDRITDRYHFTII